MQHYLEIVKNILENGQTKPNRTGINAKTLLGVVYRHNMQDGFPLLTTKRVAFKAVKVELEAFIKGITSKKWLQDRGCTIWDEWCNPSKIPQNLSEEERKEFQKKEDDLGPIYGAQWRIFNKDIDQLKNVIERLKKNPYDRRLLVSAWNPLQMDEMALPPCHVLFQLSFINEKLNLTWYQRSCDVMLGLPFNIALYALLLHLIAQEAQLPEGELVGMINDTHIYENHFDGAQKQLSCTPSSLPHIETKDFESIFDWEYTDTQIIDYNPQEKIPFDVAV